MFPIVFFLFISIPIIEIFLLIKVGSALGAWTTIAIVILTAVIGTLMLRAQSLATIRSVQNKIHSGELPATQMLEGVALLIGGALLLTPGFMTDAVGFFCLFPLTRRWLVNKIVSNANVMVYQNIDERSSVNVRPDRSGSGQQSDANVIDGEYRRED